MFCQAFGSTGLPVMKEGFAKLIEEYKEAREDVSRNVSTEKDALSMIAEYHQEIQRLLMEHEAARTSGNSSRMNDIQGKIDGLEHKYKLAKASLSTVEAILHTIDPYKVCHILGGMWIGISGCIAAAVSPSARSLNVGLSLGERLSALLRSLLAARAQRRIESSQRGGGARSEEEERRSRWAEFSLDSCCRGLGVVAAFYMQRVVNAFQGSIMLAAVLN
uniref:Uncharacterized protein n=1 Tax=Guillardia theta TaxID=55529 RepID=A0A7S4U8F5_GUITH